MKNTKWIVLPVLVFFIIGAGCGKKRTLNKLEGKWKLEEWRISLDTPNYAQQTILSGVTLEFRADDRKVVYNQQNDSVSIDTIGDLNIPDKDHIQIRSTGSEFDSEEAWNIEKLDKNTLMLNGHSTWKGIRYTYSEIKLTSAN